MIEYKMIHHKGHIFYTRLILGTKCFLAKTQGKHHAHITEGVTEHEAIEKCYEEVKRSTK